MSFPANIVVQHEVFTGAVTDGLGNDVEDWAAPVNVAVISYQTAMVENINGYTSVVVADVDMAIPATLSVSIRDRFRLPGEPKPYEVVEIQDANHGFHGWKPGYVLKLKKVTG